MIHITFKVFFETISIKLLRSFLSSEFPFLSINSYLSFFHLFYCLLTIYSYTVSFRCQTNSIAHSRMRSFNSAAKNLQNRLSISQVHSQRQIGQEQFALSTSSLNKNNSNTPVPPQDPSIDIPMKTVNVIRLIMLWSFHGNLLRLQTPSSEVSL